MMRRVYLDSCVVIYAIEGAASLRKEISILLQSPNEDSPCVVYTDLNRLECRVRPQADNQAGLLRSYDDFFATPGYEKHTLDTRTFDLATSIRAEHRIKTPDALHLAAAITAGCSQFWTNDARLARAASGRIELLALNLQVP